MRACVCDQGGFVAGFSSSNLGDVSPNTKGPHCVNTGLPCDYLNSSCPVGGVNTSTKLGSNLKTNLYPLNSLDAVITKCLHKCSEKGILKPKMSTVCMCVRVLTRQRCVSHLDQEKTCLKARGSSETTSTRKPRYLQYHSAPKVAANQLGQQFIKNLNLKINPM